MLLHRLCDFRLGNSPDKLHHQDLMLIEHNKFYLVSNRSGVVELIKMDCNLRL